MIHIDSVHKDMGMAMMHVVWLTWGDKKGSMG